MPVCELFAKRKIVESESPSAETQWTVWDDDDSITNEQQAYAALIAHPLPPTYGFASGRVADLVSVTISDIDEKSWTFVVAYSQYTPKEENDVDYSFTAGSQSVTLTHATSTTAFTGGGRTAPSFGGGVNIDENGVAKGISVERPSFSFQLTKHWPKAVVSPSYQLTVSELVGRVNDATFYSLPAGCVRLESANGRIAGSKFPITYTFSYSPPESGVTVGDISGISRAGFDYLDVYMRTTSDAGSKKKVTLPHSVYIHEVYERANFGLLGI